MYSVFKKSNFKKKKILLTINCVKRLGSGSKFRANIQDPNTLYLDQPHCFQVFLPCQVLTIITDHIPEVKAMDLSGNKLTSLDAFASFANKMPNLSILYLADNRIPDLRWAAVCNRLFCRIWT